MRPLRSTLLATAALVSGCSTSTVRNDTPIALPAPDEIVIATTSDFHAALDRSEGVASVIRRLRAAYTDQMIHLDGGDLFQGSLEGNLSKGRAMVDLYNALGLDAAAIGNHELDYGPEAPDRNYPKPGEDGLGNIKARVKQAKFAWLSSNIIKTGKRCAPARDGGPGHCNALGNVTVFEPHAIFQRVGKKVCVIGATTPSTPAITRQEFIKGVRFLDLKSVVEAEANFLRHDAGCDLVLLVAHAGLRCKSPRDSVVHINDGYCREKGDLAELLALLNALPENTLDAVVGGHTHMLAMEVVNGMPTIVTATGGREVGVLHLTGTRGLDLRARFEPFLAVPDQASEPDITALLKPYRDAGAALRARAAGALAGPFSRVYAFENPTGNLVADAVLEAGRRKGGAQFAVLNAGGVRAGLKAGAVTYGDVFEVLPFDNFLAVVELKGSELRRILEIATSGGHGSSPVSGLRIKRLDVAPGATPPAGAPWSRDLDGDGKKEDWERNLLLEVTDEAGHPLEDDRSYKIATIDFLVGGGDHQKPAYEHIPAKRRRIFYDALIRDITFDYLQKHQTPRPPKPEDYFSPAKPRVTNVAP